MYKSLINFTSWHFDALQTVEGIEIMENYLTRNRPSVDIRPQLDLGYKIEDLSIIFFEIMPFWRDSKQTIEEPVAKTTFVKSNNTCKVY